MKQFMAIDLYTTVNSAREMHDYWAVPSMRSGATFSIQHPFVRAQMSRERYEEINRAIAACTRDDLDHFEKLFNQRLGDLWIPGSPAVVDESVCSTKARKNPDHVHITGKPHGNGVKVSTCHVLVRQHAVLSSLAHALPLFLCP